MCMQPVHPDELPIKQACVHSIDISKYIFLRNLIWNAIRYVYFYKLLVLGIFLKYYKLLYFFKYL